MFEIIKCPDLGNKILREVIWKVTVSQAITEKVLLCVLVVDDEDHGLLTQILNQKLYNSKKLEIHTTIIGTVEKINSLEEILKSSELCTIKTSDENNDCEHEIEYGGMCVKCGLELEE